MVKNLGHRFNLCWVAAGVGVGIEDTPMTHRPKRRLADETMDQHRFFRCCYEETGGVHRLWAIHRWLSQCLWLQRCSLINDSALTEFQHVQIWSTLLRWLNRCLDAWPSVFPVLLGFARKDNKKFEAHRIRTAADSIHNKKPFRCATWVCFLRFYLQFYLTTAWPV